MFMLPFVLEDFWYDVTHCKHIFHCRNSDIRSVAEDWLIRDSNAYLTLYVGFAREGLKKSTCKQRQVAVH